MPQLRYVQHCVLLGCFAVLLAAADHVRLIYPLIFSFALYGTCHALALTLCLHAPEVTWREKLLFTAFSACLSIAALGIGLGGVHVIGRLHGHWGLLVSLGFSSAIGAAGYLLLIRAFRFRALTLRGVAGISVACMFATLMAFAMLGHFSLLGRWWLAVLWWYALSLGLWFCDGQKFVRV